MVDPPFCRSSSETAKKQPRAHELHLERGKTGTSLCKELIPSASRVWFGRPGHIFVATNNFHKLTTLDVQLLGGGDGGHLKKYLDLTFDLSPLHNLLFGCLDNSDCLAFLITDNGCTQVWQNKHNCGWEKLGVFELCTICSGKVSRVILDNRQHCFYWCEENFNAKGIPVHKICKRSFPTGHCKWTNDSIGEAKVLVEECPASDLYILENNLIIWPQQPCPPNLVVKWLPSLRTAEVHVLCRGCVHIQRDVTFKPLNFHETAMDLSDLWAAHNEDDDETEFVSVVPHELHDELYVVNVLGDVFSLKDTKTPQKLCRLVSRPSKDSQYFMCQFTLCEVTHSYMRFYSLATGQVKQTIDTEMGVGRVLGLWSSLSGELDSGNMMQTIGFYTEKNAFELLMTDCQGWTVEGENLAKLRDAGESILATQKLLDHNGDKSEILSNREEFESPAIPIVFLQQKATTKEPKIAIEMETLVKTCDKPNGGVSTDLNDFVSPLISEFLQLQQNILSHLNNNKSDSIQRRKIEDEVVSLIATDGATDLLERRVQLEMLAEKHQEEVLGAIMGYLHRSRDDDDTSRAEMKKWKDVLAVEPSTSQTGQILPLFEITSRLLFLEQPSQLVNFVKVSHSMSEQGYGVPGFSRKTTSLYDRALDALPDVCKSSIKHDAVMATAELILMSSRPHKQHEAMRLLLNNEVWESAISLVAQNKETELHCELFNVLFVESLKQGFLAKYTSRIMALVPEKTSVLYLLDLMQTHLKSTEEEATFCKDRTLDIRVGVIRPYLMKFLENR